MSEVKEIPRLGAQSPVFAPVDMQWAFPSVDPGIEPYGSRVLVQLRRVDKRMTAAGLVVVKETKEAEKWNNMIGKIVMLGPLAFLNRETMQPWPEGVWARPGDFVRVPKWGGDRWERSVPGEAANEEPVLFMILNDHEIIGRVTADPLSFKAYI